MIGVLGAGAFGTALAIALSREKPVTLWARTGTETLSRTRQSPRLPGLSIPVSVRIVSELGALRDCHAVLLAMPMQSLARFLEHHGQQLPNVPLVACCKGLDLASLKGPTGIIADACPDVPSAILTGPSFAVDIAAGLPTALTLAVRDVEVGVRVQSMLSTKTLRVYLGADPLGAELGGALKNVIAIGCGAAIGAGLGDSARAALMTRGFSEMQRLARALGAQAETLNGLSGLGDLALTCTSEHSRNFRYGLALGKNAGFDPDLTVEGAATARAVTRLARQNSLDLPVCATVAALVQGETDVQGAMARLLARPLSSE